MYQTQRGNQWYFGTDRCGQKGRRGALGVYLGVQRGRQPHVCCLVKWLGAQVWGEAADQGQCDVICVAALRAREITCRRTKM